MPRHRDWSQKFSMTRDQLLLAGVSGDVDDEIALMAEWRRLYPCDHLDSVRVLQSGRTWCVSCGEWDVR